MTWGYPDDGGLERSRLVGRQVMAHQPATAVFEGRDHGVDVLGAREQQQRRRALGNLRAHLVEEGVMEMRSALGFAQPARGRTADDSHRESRGAEEQPGHGAGQRPFGGPFADHVAALVDVDVAARERAAHDDPVMPVVLHERELVHPHRLPEVSSTCA